jgi:hypothetical protein
MQTSVVFRVLLLPEHKSCHSPSTSHQRNLHIRLLLLLYDTLGVVGVSPGMPVFSLKVLSSQQPGMLSSTKQFASSSPSYPPVTVVT